MELEGDEGIFSVIETRKREGDDGFSMGFLAWSSCFIYLFILFVSLRGFL